MKRYCIEGCGRETGAYSKTGRSNPYWCPECDEKRIERISKSLEQIEQTFSAPEPRPADEPFATSKDSLQVEPATAPTVGDAIQASESNSPETPDGSPRDCDTCRWEGRSLLCCDCRDYAHWQPVPSPSEENPSPMTMAEIRIAMQDQCKETQSLRSQLARKDEGLRKALVYLSEHLRHLRARNDPKALSLTNDLAAIRAALGEPDGRKGES